MILRWGALEERLYKMDYYYTIPTGLASSLLCKSRSYDLVKEHKDLVLDEKLLEFIGTMELEDISDKYIYILSTAIKYKFYTLLEKILDDVIANNPSRKRISFMGGRLHYEVAESRDLRIISIFLDRNTKYVPRSIIDLAFIKEYELVENVANRYGVERKERRRWILTGVAMADDREYIEELLKEVEIEEVSHVLSSGAVCGGRLNLLKWLVERDPTCTRGKLFAFARFTRVKTDDMSMMKYLIERGEVVTQQIVRLIIMRDDAVKRVRYLLTLGDFDLKKLLRCAVRMRRTKCAKLLFGRFEDGVEYKEILRKKFSDRLEIVEFLNGI